MKTKSNKPKMPPCPRCKTSAEVTRPFGEEYFCERCKGMFDSNPNEGGDFSDRNASARLEREEREQANKQQRRKR